MKVKGEFSAIFLTAMMLISCGTEPEGTLTASVSAKEALTLNVWYQEDNPSSAFNREMTASALQYENEHPGIRLALHSLDSASYKEKLAEDFTGKARDIDVFYDWGPAKLTQLVKAGRVLPLDDYVTQEKLSEIKENLADSFRIDGKIYGLPMNSSMMLIYCNRSLFRKAGIDLPTTYAELLRSGEELKKLNVRPLEVGAGDSWLAGALYENLAMREVGAKKCSDVLSGASVMSDDAGFRTAAEKMNELYRDGILGDNPLQITDTDALSDFINGKSAMLLDGSWAAGSIDNTTDKIAEDVVPIIFPLAEPGFNATDYVGGTSVSFFVNKNTESPRESADAALYLAERIGRLSCEMGLGFSCWKNSANDLTPTLAAAQVLFENAGENIRSWDTVLDTAKAKAHLKACQGLLADSPDFDDFLEKHMT